MRACEEFLLIAKEDLRAAEFLYIKHLYPQALFYLQQSIEKSFKSLGSLCGNLSSGELKKGVGHFPLRVLSYLITKLTKISEMQQSLRVISMGHDEMLITPDKLNETVKMINNVSDSDAINARKMRELINILLKYMAKSVRIKNLKVLVPTVITGIESYVRIIKNKYARNMTESKFSKIINAIQKVFPDISEAEYLLMMLSLAISPISVQNTRYPTRKGIPGKIYNTQHYLVKAFPKLVKYCRIAQEKLAYVFRVLGNINGKQG